MVSVILPVLNEPNISNMVMDIISYLNAHSRALKYDYEIVIVESERNKIPININHDRVKIYKSYGDSLERSILLGLSVAKGEKIIVMDSDGSHPPYLLPEIIDNLDKFDAVYTYRSETSNRSFLRVLVSSFFNFYAKFFGCKLKDPMSGFFGIRRSVLNGIKFKPYTWKVGLEIYFRKRPNYTEIPFIFNEREKGKSKANWKIGLKILWDILEDRL